MRIDNWEIALEELIEEKYDAPFEWGEHDCASFAANAIQAITGVDVYEPYRGKYTDAVSAFLLIKQVTGGTTVEDTMTHAMLTHEFIVSLPSVYFAHRGDIVSYKDGDDITLGVVGFKGTHAWFTGGDIEFSQLIEIPIDKCKCGWGIR